MHGFCTVFARFQTVQRVLFDAKYDKGCRNYAVKNHDVLHKNDVNSKLLKSECSTRWALLIRGPGIRVPSSAPKGRQIAETNGLSSFLFYTVLGACTCDFFKKFRGQRYKNEEDPEEL